MKKQRSYFLLVTGWGLILADLLLIPLLVVQNIAINRLFMEGRMDDATISAFNRIEVVFYSNLREFLAFFLLASLVLLVSAIALLRRKRWSLLSLSILLGVGIGGMALLSGSYWYYDYEVTLWPEPERNTRFVRNAFLIMGSLSLLFGWLIYKLNSPRIRRMFEPELS